MGCPLVQVRPLATCLHFRGMDGLWTFKFSADALKGFENCTSLSNICTTYHSIHVAAMAAALSSSVRRCEHLQEVTLVVKEEG
jgi:hypothetical protein